MQTYTREPHRKMPQPYAMLLGLRMHEDVHAASTGHFQGLFYDGMIWHMLERLEIDHRVPRCDWNLCIPAQRLACLHWRTCSH